MKKTIEYLKQKKRRGEKISVLTGYDYPTAVWEDEAGVDVIHVGDSVGTNLLGYSSEREVTMEDMLHHLKAVVRGAKTSHVTVDLPYMSYETPEQALENCSVFIEAGADGIKLEGVKPQIVAHLAERGIPVWGHLGYNPQIHERAALQAKTGEAAVQLIEDSLRVQDAGAVAMVYEVIPEEVARAATARLAIPTIGIASGRYTDGQVIVVTDLLGMHPGALRHVKKYADFRALGIEACRAYARDVESGAFPGEANVRHLKEDEQRVLDEWLNSH